MKESAHYSRFPAIRDALAVRQGARKTSTIFRVILPESGWPLRSRPLRWMRLCDAPPPPPPPPPPPQVPVFAGRQPCQSDVGRGFGSRAYWAVPCWPPQ